MNYYARLENNIAVEIIIIPCEYDIRTMYPGDFIKTLVSCTDAANIGDIYKNGNFTPPPPPEPALLEPEPDPKGVILGQLNELDFKTIRPLRAILANNASEEDQDYLQDLEAQAQALRVQLAELTKLESVPAKTVQQ